jgi:hypothetical protein
VKHIWDFEEKGKMPKTWNAGPPVLRRLFKGLMNLVLRNEFDARPRASAETVRARMAIGSLTVTMADERLAA